MGTETKGTETRTYSTKEVAQIFGYSIAGYLKMVKEERAPVMPIPGTRRYSKAMVDFIVDAQDALAKAKADYEAAS